MIAVAPAMTKEREAGDRDACVGEARRIWHDQHGAHAREVHGDDRKRKKNDCDQRVQPVIAPCRKKDRKGPERDAQRDRG